MCWWQQMVGALLPQTNGQCTGLRGSAVFTTAKTVWHCLSLSLPLCLFFLLPPWHQMDEWLSLSVSSLSALSSSVSLLAHSFLCRISDLSLTPAIRRSSHPFCPLDECLSLRNLFFPSFHPVGFLFVCVLKGESAWVCVCVLYRSRLWVCVYLCPPDHYLFPRHLASLPCCVSVAGVWIKVNGDLLADTHRPLNASLPHTHPEGLYVFCQSDHLYVPAMPASAQFSTAQLGSMD